MGVFLILASSYPYDFSIPHTRGGVSSANVICFPLNSYSPHAWGCFSGLTDEAISDKVFPTRVGVFPEGSIKAWSRKSIPHTRGGVSIVPKGHLMQDEYSPHAWGCFDTMGEHLLEELVFPTRVGVFPCSTMGYPYMCRIPHTRGGVSVSLVSL